MFHATPSVKRLARATESAERRLPVRGAHLLDYRADGCDLEARIPVPAQRRPGDRRVPRRPAGPACARRPHRGGPGARPAARVRPRHGRRGRRDGRGRPGRSRRARRPGSPSRCASIRSTARSRGRWCSSTAPTPRCSTRSTAGSAEAAAPGTRVRIRWADETEGKITDIARASRLASDATVSEPVRAVHVADDRGRVHGCREPSRLAQAHRARRSPTGASSGTSARSAARSTCRRAGTARCARSRPASRRGRHRRPRHDHHVLGDHADAVPGPGGEGGLRPGDDPPRRLGRRRSACSASTASDRRRAHRAAGRGGVAPTSGAQVSGGPAGATSASARRSRAGSRPANPTRPLEQYADYIV